MKFSIKDFFSKWDQIRSFLRIWSHLLKKSLMENLFFVPKKDEILFHLELKFQIKFYWELISRLLFFFGLFIFKNIPYYL